jgi:hypothetical protein
METQALPITPPTPAGQSINLRIAGADLLLSGRFEQWVPLALAEGKDESAAQLLLDVTSTPRSREGKTIKPATELFSFTSTSVESVAPQSYRAKGRLRSHGVTRQTEVLLHSPVGHTPFFIMTVPIDREIFGELWTELEDRAAVTAVANDRELRPRAWLRAPELAAA